MAVAGRAVTARAKADILSDRYDSVFFFGFTGAARREIDASRGYSGPHSTFIVRLHPVIACKLNRPGRRLFFAARILSP